MIRFPGGSFLEFPNGARISFVESPNSEPLRGTSIGPELIWSMALADQDARYERLRRFFE